MIRPRWRKVLSDLWDNKARTVLVVFSIAIGVFSAGMIAGAYGIISRDMSSSYASANPANIVITTDRFDDDFLTTISHLPGVRQAEGRRFVRVRARSGDGQWVSFDLVAEKDYAESQVDLLVPTEGELFPQDKQVILEEGGLKKITAQVGALLEIQLPDNRIKTLPIKGIVLDQTTGAGNWLASPMGFITFDTLDWLGQPTDYNRLLVTVADQPNDEAHISQISKEISDKIEKSGRQVYRTHINKTHEHPLQSTVQAILGILGALGVLIVFLSSSLIANTLNALLNQHLRHIGVMKLVGARNYQVFGMYIALIMTFGAIALAISIPLGGQAAYALSKLIALEMNFKLYGYRVIPEAILLQVVIGIFIPLGAGFVPVNNGSRITVLRAISGNMAEPAPAHSQEKQADAPQKGFAAWLPRPMLLSLRNTFRRKGRLALTLFTLTMGGAIFIAVFNVRDSLNNYVTNIGHYFVADVTVNFERPYRVHEINQVALQIPGVRASEGWAYASADILWKDGSVAENLQILAPPAGSKLISPMLLSGRWVQPGDEKALAVSEAILETFPNLKPGDLFHMKIAGHEEDWVVVGIFKFVGATSLLAYANYDYVSGLIHQSGQAATFRLVTDRHDKDYQNQISAVIDRYFRDRNYRVSDVQAGLSNLKTASEGLGILITFLMIMALLTASVGAMGLTGTMGMNVMERTREIGVMRSIGAVDRVVMQTVILEGVVIGLISWFLGALLSFPISTMLSAIISQAIFKTSIGFAFTYQGFVIWLVLVIVLAVLASTIPARNAARLTIREVLAYE